MKKDAVLSTGRRPESKTRWLISNASAVNERLWRCYDRPEKKVRLGKSTLEPA